MEPKGQKPNSLVTCPPAMAATQPVAVAALGSSAAPAVEVPLQHLSTWGVVQKFWTVASQPVGAEPPVPYVLFEAAVAKARGAMSAATSRVMGGAIDVGSSEAERWRGRGGARLWSWTLITQRMACFGWGMTRRMGR